MQSKAIFVIRTWSASLLVAACLVGLASGKKPNVLFIAVDDLKPTMGAYGDRMAITPNIDRLADAGTVFLNNHCQKAICGPSRASVMTGMRPDSIKVWEFGDRMREINPDIVSLPEYFMNHGYTTTAMGKIYDPRNVNDKWDTESWSIPHKEYGDLLWNPDYPRPINGQYFNDASKKSYDEAIAKGLQGYHAIDKYMRNGDGRPAVECTDVPDNAYKDGALALCAIKTLKELGSSGKPFFLGVGFAKPHLPFVAPKKYWDLYDREKISANPFQKKSANPVDMAYHGSGELKGYTDIPNSMNSYSDDPERWLAEEKQRELIHGYYACTSYVDAQIGLVMQALKETGLAENTVVVLWGDHGFHLGDHGLWHKHTNFEQATRSPLIISAPGFNKGLASAPTEFIDIFPTLCDLTGLPIPEKLDGVSLVPMMQKPNVSVKDFAVSQYSYNGCMGYTIRTERYRYTEWIKDWRTFQPFDSSRVRGRELYDYQKDPAETMNQVDNPEYKKVLEEMQRHMHQFFKACRQKG